MKFDHMVKHNGKFYAAGENVPEKPVRTDSKPAVAESVTEKKRVTRKG